ncbi:unnamed protein product, partial [Musa acuminata subsp. burmannicoides]
MVSKITIVSGNYWWSINSAVIPMKRCIPSTPSCLSSEISSASINLTEKIIAEYICKLPKRNYDGSSAGQAPGDDSEVILYPQAVFKGPFRRENNILVNLRNFYSHPDHEQDEILLCGIEQEYTLLQEESQWPLG